MSLPPDDLKRLAAWAVTAARQAGELIASSRPEHIEHKPGGFSPASQVVTEVDRRCQDLILATLAPSLEHFDLAVLAEEREDDGLRASKAHFWCIDPLDGTLPFIEDTPGYAVSIALVAQDGTPQIGVIFDPREGTLYHAIRAQGAFRNERPWPVECPSNTTTLSVFADRSFKTNPEYDAVMTALEQMAREMGLQRVELHATGAAVMNACGVLANPRACYFKLPKPYPCGGCLWDFAATACLFHEAGAIATDMHGGPLDLNRSDSLFMSHRGVLFASDSDLAKRLGALGKLID